jgi:hypothetical protein
VGSLFLSLVRLISLSLSRLERVEQLKRVDRAGLVEIDISEARAQSAQIPLRQPEPLRRTLRLRRDQRHVAAVERQRARQDALPQRLLARFCIDRRAWRRLSLGLLFLGLLL